MYLDPDQTPSLSPALPPCIQQVEGCLDGVEGLHTAVGHGLHPGYGLHAGELVQVPAGHRGPHAHPQHVLQALGRHQGG